MSPYTLQDDQLEVVKAPDPGGAGGLYRAFGETLRGLKTTFARVAEGPMTIQYPEQKVPVYPRFRGRHKLHRFEDTGIEKCVGCSLCAAACPADCIRVVAAENTPENRVSAGERYAAVYEINMSRCIFCGYCEVACPFDAITLENEYEMSERTRGDLLYNLGLVSAAAGDAQSAYGLFHMSLEVRPEGPAADTVARECAKLKRGSCIYTRDANGNFK